MDKLIKITQGNINNGHIYLSKIIDIFPKESIGGSNKNFKGKELKIDIQGVGKVETDIAGDKKIFRNRSWINSFFNNCNITAGDEVCIQKIAKFQYKLLMHNSNLKNETITKQKIKTLIRKPKDKVVKNISKIPNNPRSGLIIADPWISKILSGEKYWEMRGNHTAKRGPIALIKKGTGTIVGTANIVDSLGPFDEASMIKNYTKHQIPKDMIKDGSVKKWVYAWVLKDIKELKNPMPYTHPSGAVIWVNL